MLYKKHGLKRYTSINVHAQALLDTAYILEYMPKWKMPQLSKILNE